MTHDRTPAPPLDETELQAIEQRAREHYFDRVTETPYPWKAAEGDVPALVAALRAAWRENARYRAALEEIALGLSAINLAREPGGVRFADRLDVLETRVRAALAAPGAGGQATEERTT